MICPLCGKLSPDSNTLCIYCGSARIKTAPAFRGAGSFTYHPDEYAEEPVYEIHNTTEFEWGCYVEQAHRTNGFGFDVHQHGGQHEWSPVTEMDDGSAGTDERPATRVEEPVHPEPVSRAPEREPAPEPAAPEREAVAVPPAPAPSIVQQAASVVQPVQVQADVSDSANATGKNPPQPAVPASSAGSVAAQPAPPQKKRVRMVSEEEMLRTLLKGRYDIIRKLGTGGMATVYLAHELALDRDVAIKVLPQSFLRDKQFVERFRREARLAARLEHPNIVRIYRIGEEARLCYFVMSYIPGGTIADRVKTYGSLPHDDIVRWGADVCSALGYAHEHGVIHRDLKPDNIMLDHDGRAIVMDFGIAHAVEGTNFTRTGALIGTPQYMSPDQAMGRPLDARSDIYSFGMVLYKMTAGKLPFKSKDPLSLMYMHVNKTPQPPDVFNPNVPQWLRDIILKCIAKRPEDRFGSAYELRDALLARKSPPRQLSRPMPQEKEKIEKTGSGLFDAAAHILSGAFAGFRTRH